MPTPVQETIIFLSTCMMIDEIVNHYNMTYFPSEQGTEIRFEDDYREKYFLIIMVDFLSCIDDDQFDIPPNTSHLKLLHQSSSNSYFNDSQELAEYVAGFRDWLNTCVRVPIWLGSIRIEGNIFVRRVDIIKLCGNASKHSLTRSSGIVASAIEMLRQNDIRCEHESSLFLLPELYEQFYDRVISLHFHVLSEFLVNIRWKIHEHLWPTFQSSYTQGEGLFYSYDIPSELNSELSKIAFWNLMNLVRSRPIVERFTVPSLYHERY